jgi:hypothetical protein
MACGANLGKFRWFYTGNEVGFLNHTGLYNFMAGGPSGSGISAGTTVKKFFPGEISRALWEYPNSKLNQELLNAAYPFIELNWIADITISDAVTFRVSDRNIYVEDINLIPYFYEARVAKGPSINVTSGEWLSPSFEIGDLKLEINNRDGFFNDYLPQGVNYLQWTGSKVSIKVGFGESYSNYYEVFTGKVASKQGVTGTAETIILKIYDRAADDEIPIPASVFDRTNYPNTDPSNMGKVLPIIYGDWSIEAGTYGEIPAICSNAQDTNASVYVWNISENALREIGDVYLHRGDNIPDKDGPILLLNSAITKFPESGKIEIPVNIPSLSKNYLLLDRVRAGLGSGVRTLVADSVTTNYEAMGVQIDDVVLIDGDPSQYVIDSVSTGIITTLTGNFPVGTNYRIITDKYKFKKGDKLSIFCKGKDLAILSTTRISDSGIIGMNPRGLSVALDNSYWTIDNDAQKVYNITFNNRVQKTINFADIDPSITFISSLVVQYDGTLWLLERNQSKVYRYIVAENALGLSFTTLSSGIDLVLGNPSAITIDEGNVLTIVDNDTGIFYRVNPFSPTLALLGSFNKSAFAPLAIDIVDLGFDVSVQNLIVLDRATSSYYRINPTTGALISSRNVLTIANNFNYPVGIGYYIDGTIFILNKSDLSIYNYNEFLDCSDNVGFICRNILQSYAGKTSFDFDLLWNETSRLSLNEYKARAHISEKVNAINYIHTLLSGFNANAYIRMQKYALYQINFSNFKTTGDILREGDIKEKTFNPSKEYNQYFNTATASYKYLPFSASNISSDIYVSPSGVKLAGREIAKKLEMKAVYRRADLDKLVPLFVRLAAAEPEFVNLTTGFRMLFTQLNAFYNINYTNVEFGKTSGRRFNMVPSFVRSYTMNLDTMQISMKLWSLGTTQFGSYMPEGVIGGGANDNIILTNLGTVGYVSPVGQITSSSPNTLILSLVSGIDAQSRTNSRTGNAWLAGFKIGIYNAATQVLIEEKTILSVVGQVITFTDNILTIIVNTQLNSSGLITGGHYLKYTSYPNVIDAQKAKFGYFTKPIDGYPTTTSKETDELRAGLHKFDDQRLSYIYHPFDYIPAT